MSSKLSAFSALNGYCVYNNRCDGEYRVCRNNFGRDVNNKKREKVGFNQIFSFFSATATESLDSGSRMADAWASETIVAHYGK